MTREPERLSAKSWIMIGALIMFFPLMAAVVSFWSGKHKGGLSLIERFHVEGVKFAPQLGKVSPELADARFPEQSWDPKVLAILEDGPLLLPEDSDFKVLPPPPNTSAVAEAGLEKLRLYAKHLRTPEQLALIDAEHTMDEPYEAFEKNGMFLSASNEDTVELLDMALRDTSYFVIKLKREFMRVRPNTLAPDLTLVFDNPGHPAYPSGHATQAYVTALVLSLVDPAHESAYKALGYDVGLRREIAGVHYPSDSIAGRKLAQAIMDKLVEVPAFQEQLEKARKSFVPADGASIAAYKPVDTSAVGDGAKAE